MEIKKNTKNMKNKNKNNKKLKKYKIKKIKKNYVTFFCIVQHYTQMKRGSRSDT
jgi:hypothetical protein